MNHRSVWALAGQARTKEDLSMTEQMSAAVVSTEGSIALTETENESVIDISEIDAPTLIVVSKVKNLIKEQSGLNTSKCAVEALTRKVVEACINGIENARNDSRKTLMGRDIL